MLNMKKSLSLVLSVLLLLSSFLPGIGVTNAFATNVITDKNIFFEKPDEWKDVYCYVWGGKDGEAVCWPGSKMSQFSGNIWSYTIPGDQWKVIFSDGGGIQTEDLVISGSKNYFEPNKDITRGDGKISGKWYEYHYICNKEGGVMNQNNPTVTFVYLRNKAGWKHPMVYFWKNHDNTGNFNNAEWPGVRLSDADKSKFEIRDKKTVASSDDIYEVAIPAEYFDQEKDASVIFSELGDDEHTQVQSRDLVVKTGKRMIYDNSNGKWEEYGDANKLNFISLNTSESSPIYKETEVGVWADAVYEEDKGNAVVRSSDNIKYGFRVINKDDKDKEKVIDNNGDEPNYVCWKPTETGSYRIEVEITKGNDIKNVRTIDYVVKDDSKEKEPILKGISPVCGSSIKINEKVDVNINASGGKVGTNLLFYKVQISKENEPKKILNKDVYYSCNNKYSFTPTEPGCYIISVSVQNSENITVIRDYKLYVCGNELKSG